MAQGGARPPAGAAEPADDTLVAVPLEASVDWDNRAGLPSSVSRMCSPERPRRNSRNPRVCLLPDGLSAASRRGDPEAGCPGDPEALQASAPTEMRRSEEVLRLAGLQE